MLQRIGQRVLAWEALPALAVLLFAVGVSLYAPGTSEVWGARAPDVGRTSGAQGKSQESEAKLNGFGCLFLWALRGQRATSQSPRVPHPGLRLATMTRSRSDWREAVAKLAELWKAQAEVRRASVPRPKASPRPSVQRPICPSLPVAGIGCISSPARSGEPSASV